MQYNAIPCNTMQYHAIPCNTMQYHAIQCIINNCWRSVPLPCGQYNGHFLLQFPCIYTTVPLYLECKTNIVSIFWQVSGVKTKRVRGGIKQKKWSFFMTFAIKGVGGRGVWSAIKVFFQILFCFDSHNEFWTPPLKWATVHIYRICQKSHSPKPNVKFSSFIFQMRLSERIPNETYH